MFQSGISLSICLHVTGVMLATTAAKTAAFQSGISLSICLHSSGTACRRSRRWSIRFNQASA